MAARLKEKYQNQIKQALQKELGLENALAVPRLDKIVINMGLGEATQNSKLLDLLVADLAQITGQKPVTTPELGDGGVESGLKKTFDDLPRAGVRDGVPGDVLKALQTDPAKRKKEQLATLREYFQWSQPTLQPVLIEVQRLKAERSMVQTSIPVVLRHRGRQAEGNANPGARELDG